MEVAVKPFAAVSFQLLILSVACAQQPASRPANLPPSIDYLPNIQYANPGNHPQSLDVYVRKDAKEKLPVIVAIHGGGWTGGDKRNPFVLPLLKDGYAIVSINYRLSQVAKFPAQLKDCKAAIRWVRANAEKYHFDPDHIGVWGDSAGGHLVALLGTTANNKDLEGDEGNLKYSSRVQAVCDFYGPADFLTINDQAPPDTAIHHNAPDSPEALLIDGPIPDNKDKAAQASPVHYVTKDAAPFLIMHGDNDKLVPLAQSQELAAALKKAGVDATLHVVQGAGHGFPRHPELIAIIRAFFDQHLKAGQ
jgi:acetyl esterase/lipase